MGRRKRREEGGGKEKVENERTSGNRGQLKLEEETGTAWSDSPNLVAASPMLICLVWAGNVLGPNEIDSTSPSSLKRDSSSFIIESTNRRWRWKVNFSPPSIQDTDSPSPPPPPSRNSRSYFFSPVLRAFYARTYEGRRIFSAINKGIGTDYDRPSISSPLLFHFRFRNQSTFPRTEKLSISSFTL